MLAYNIIYCNLLHSYVLICCLDVRDSIRRLLSSRRKELYFFKNTCYNLDIMVAEGTALIIQIILGIVTVISFAAAGVRWLVKHYFNDIRAELKPNGGSSLKDQVNRLEKDMSILKDKMLREEREQDDIKKKLDKMYDILLNYISHK